MEPEHSSRQSMASSSLSMATTVSESEKNEKESLFPNRWEDENEMDKGLKILRRKQAATVRLRKMNDVHDRILEGRIRFLSTHFSQKNKELKKQTNYLKDEILEVKPNELHLPRIESSTSYLTDSRSTSRLSETNNTNDRSNSRSQEQTCQTCFFDPNNTNLRCRHFPCCLPRTYNSLSEMNTQRQRANTYSVVRNYKQLLRRCQDLRPATTKPRQEETENNEEIEQTSHAPRTTIKEKIRGLKQFVKEMKERNEKTKPRDWAINYGDPVPRRVILKPVKTY